MISPLSSSFLALTLIISFSFSIQEKLIDSTSYQIWLKDHFKNTIVLPFLKPLFYFIILLEVITSLILIYGLYQLWFLNNYSGLFVGSIVSFICFVILLIGQRVAKDYQSSANLMLYILVSLFSFYLSELGMNY